MIRNRGVTVQKNYIAYIGFEVMGRYVFGIQQGKEKKNLFLLNSGSLNKLCLSSKKKSGVVVNIVIEGRDLKCNIEVLRRLVRM